MNNPFSLYAGPRLVYMLIYHTRYSDSPQDGGKLISAGADNAARMFDLSNPQNGQSSQVAQHDKPIKCVRWIETPTGGILATGSWDKTIKVRVFTPLYVFSLVQYWTLGNPTPVGTVQLPERLYSMDVVYPLLVAATAERRIVIINLSQPTTIFRVCYVYSAYSILLYNYLGT